MRRHARLIICALAAYIALLLLLVAAEAQSGEASIRGFWDAVWFSIVTMTTVGYGDLSPVTPLGRVLGVIFALCSIGILTALIGVGLRLVGGELLPRLRLRFGRGRKWYVFGDDGEDAAALASALRERDGDCLLLFPEGQGGRVGGEKVIRADFGPAEIKKLRGGTEGVRLFFVGPDGRKNYSEALAACGEGLSCSCMCGDAPGRAPEELQLFSPAEALSRSYWKEHPLLPGEERVLLIGCGETGSALLERALLTNIFELPRRTEYHVFGDTALFAALHPELVRALSGDRKDDDSLFLRGEDWTEARELIAAADRIIVCSDSDEENVRTCGLLRDWFVSSAKVHVRLSESVPGLVCFGARASFMRPELVIRDELNRRARLMNDIYNEGSASPRRWEELSPFLRQSNIAAADHLIVKARCLLGDDGLTELDAESCRAAAERWRALPEERRTRLLETEHRRWMRFHQMYNWSYSPERDNALRRHPLMLPFGELGAEEQAKDAYAWEMLGRIAEK